MRQSKLFTKTTKTIPAHINSLSYKLLYQAGFVRESVAGRYYFLPLGIRVRDKIMKIIENKMDNSGALKMIAPVLHPLELWEETNRTNTAGFELMKVKDRRGAEFALGGTAEEMMVDLIRNFNISYRDLPFNIYQFSQKFRDELRARGGLLRVREFMMKDAYSFHVDEEDFKKEYQKMSKTYTEIFKEFNLNTILVESDNGYIGGDYCHEFVVVSEAGESRFLISEDNNYAAHEDVAKFKKENKNLDEVEKIITKVEAVRGNTMADGVKMHNLPLWQQLKTVMFINENDKLILAAIRGDFNVNKTKLANLTKSNNLELATDKEIRIAGTEPGFISPVGINKNILVVADDSLRTVKNFYGGANKKNVDLLNVNIQRDFIPDIEGDIALAEAGFVSEAGKVLKEKRGIEVGNIFQLGHHYSSKMNALFTDKNGDAKPYYMGCYGIGVGRTMATIVEIFNDENGIIWPEAISPFKYHLINLSKNEKVIEQAENIYKELIKRGEEVLFDDRIGISVGEKFKDADLIGIPNRLVVSDKTSGKIEVKKRGASKTEMKKLEELLKK